MGWRLARRIFFATLVFLAIAIGFRQGLIPAAYAPLPSINLERSYPLIVDWQLALAGRDRGWCGQVLRQDGLVARPIPDRPLNDGCGWTTAVSMISAGGAKFPVGRINCGVAVGLALWMRHVVQPEAKRLFNAEVVWIRNMGTYSCRNIIGTEFWKGRRSQHATANAIDIGAFRLSDGTTISVLKHWRAKDARGEFLRQIHYGACSYFRVTLGPEFNAAHRDHFHFDRGPFWRCV